MDPATREQYQRLEERDAQLSGTRSHRLDKRHVVDWLLQSDEDAVLWALARLESQRPSLMARVQASPLSFLETPRSEYLAAELSESREKAFDVKDEFKPSNPRITVGRTMIDSEYKHAPTVQFGSAYTYCSEEDGVARLEVIRIGDPEPRIEVWATTKSNSAKAGVKFLPLEVKVVFEPGQREAEVTVTLIDDESWDPNLELSVQLKKDGLVGATLGRYLWQTRVKIIDDDPFPTNKNKDKLIAQQSQDISPVVLFIEYAKMNYQNPTIRWRTNLVACLGQMDNLVFLCELFASVYLIDYVFNLHDNVKTPPWVIQDEWVGLLLCSLCYVLPFTLVHWLHYIRASFGHVGGNSRKILQSALLRQFLNFDYEARNHLRSSDLVMSASRDSNRLVSHGYKALIRLLESVGHLSAVLTFQLTSPILFHRQTSPICLLLLLLFPVLIVIFLGVRHKLTSKMVLGRVREENKLVDYVRHMVDNYQLIADYHKRPHAVDQFEVRIDAFNKENRIANGVLLNNAYFIVWVGKAMVCAWVLIGGARVLNDDLTLGMFLVNIRICVTIGKSWKRIYEILLDISCVLPILQHLVRFVNSPTDVELRSTLERHNKQVTGICVDGEKREFSDLPIQMANVDFSYRSRNSNGNERTTILRNQGLLEVQQGELVCLVGPRGGGKTTVLKLLCGEILPSASQAERLSELSCNGLGASSARGTSFEGDERIRFYVPSHLRVLGVATEPMFVPGSLLENLTYGVHSENAGNSEDQDASKDRVKRICSRLGVGHSVLQLIENEEAHKWHTVISQTEKHLLCLARAFVANPEVLCLHKPTLILDSQHVDNLHKLLTEFVTCCGIERGSDDVGFMAPRTCIFTTVKTLVPPNADRVYHINAVDGIRLEPHDDSFFASASMKLVSSY